MEKIYNKGNGKDIQQGMFRVKEKTLKKGNEHQHKLESLLITFFKGSLLLHPKY